MKKSMIMTTLGLMAMIVGVTVFIFGLGYYLTSQGALLLNSKFLISDVYNSIKEPLFELCKTLIICAITVSIFYLVYSNALISMNITKVYPYVAIGIIILVSVIGYRYLDESRSTNKTIGIIIGLIAIWFLS